MKLVYPAHFETWGNGEGYTVTIPDLPGCITEGATLADAILMAQDAAAGWVLDELEDGNPVPHASHPQDLQPKEGQFMNLLVLDMDAYTEKYGDRAVRKNLTIPAWLNTFAEKRNVNFSKVLQDALTAMYQSSVS